MSIPTTDPLDGAVFILNPDDIPQRVLVCLDSWMDQDNSFPLFGIGPL